MQSQADSRNTELWTVTMSRSWLKNESQLNDMTEELFLPIVLLHVHTSIAYKMTWYIGCIESSKLKWMIATHVSEYHFLSCDRG